MRKFTGGMFGSSSMGRREFLRKVGATTAGAAAITGIMGPFDYLRANIGSGEKGIYISGISYRYISGLNSNTYILRVDTNKGISGYGECRCEDSNSILSELNSMMSTVIGMNPTQVDKVFAAIKNTGTPGGSGSSTTVNSGGFTNIPRHTGAMCGIENACWDITGKAYNVPVWKLIGPKINDRMRMYADTPQQNSQQALVSAIDLRVGLGFTWYKMDLSYNGMYPRLTNRTDYTTTPGNATYPYTQITITDSGISKLLPYAQAYRAELVAQGTTASGFDLKTAPISSDHNTGWTGPNYLDIASANAWTKAMYDTSAQGPWGGWHEDIIPWWLSSPFTPSYPILDQIHSGNNSFVSATPILTGEDMYSLDEYKLLIDAGAVDYIHPDQASSGGIHQTRLAAMYAHSKGIKTALHQSGSPFSMAASAHIAAGIPDFLACEHHYPDNISWFDTLVDGMSKPLMQNGYVPIPQGPGLGVTPNEANMSQHGSRSWTQL